MRTKNQTSRRLIARALLDGITDTNKIYWKVAIECPVTRQGVRLVLEELTCRGLARREEYTVKCSRVRYKPLPALGKSNLVLENNTTEHSGKGEAG